MLTNVTLNQELTAGADPSGFATAGLPRACRFRCGAAIPPRLTLA
jgi:hypothetical protein